MMMRYQKSLAEADNDCKRIEAVIKDTLSRYGFHGTLARDHSYFPDLWRNVEHCIEHSNYGIAVCEQATPEFNANVAVELGYMTALRKDVLILKDKEVNLPENLHGRLFSEFTRSTLEADIERAITNWLSYRGHTLMTETILGSNAIESQKARTRRIIEVLEDARSDSIIRHAGVFSTLAITKGEALADSDSDEELKDLLLREHNEMIAALKRGVFLRCIISPHIQKVALDLNFISPERVRRDALPRIQQLIQVIERKQPNLQIVCVAYLPYPNMFIMANQLFIGRRRLGEKGFPSTTIVYDPKLVQDETAQFDVLFSDAARAILGKGDCTEEDYCSEQLKDKVIKHLKKCNRDLQEQLKRHET